MPNTIIHAAPLVGRAYALPAAAVVVPKLAKSGGIRREINRYRDVFEATRDRFRTIRESTRNPELTAALRFHEAILADPDLSAAVETGIRDEGLTAATAIGRAFADAIKRVGQNGGYIGSRADDFREVRDRVIEKLLGRPGGTKKIRFREPTVILCERLTLEMLSRFDAKHVVAVLAASGGTNSHAAIALAAEGIPLLIDPYYFASVKDGEIIAVQPPVAETPAGVANASILLPDGTAITVAPLVNTLADTVRPGFSGFAGIGLCRTEFAVPGSNRHPTVEEQYRSYRLLAATMPGKRSCFRLFDVEPDKPGSGADEGDYGAGYLIEHPAVLEDQLTALLMTSAEHDVDILVPMVETTAELDAIDRHLSLCAARVRELAGAAELRYRLGAMIESSRAIANLPSFRHLRFVSIGSNDLVADLFHATRTEAGFDPRHFTDPRFTDAVENIAAVASRQGLEVSLCGAAADDRKAIRAAVRAGIRRFVPSVSAAYAIYPTLAEK